MGITGTNMHQETSSQNRIQSIADADCFLKFRVGITRPRMVNTDSMFQRNANLVFWRILSLLNTNSKTCSRAVPVLSGNSCHTPQRGSIQDSQDALPQIPMMSPPPTVLKQRFYRTGLQIMAPVEPTINANNSQEWYIIQMFFVPWWFDGKKHAATTTAATTTTTRSHLRGLLIRPQWQNRRF